MTTLASLHHRLRYIMPYMERCYALLILVRRIDLPAVKQLLYSANLAQPRQLHDILLDGQARLLVRHSVELMLAARVRRCRCGGHLRGPQSRGSKQASRDRKRVTSDVCAGYRDICMLERYSRGLALGVSSKQAGQQRAEDAAFSLVQRDQCVHRIPAPAPSHADLSGAAA
jgi:hypothetical protein